MKGIFAIFALILVMIAVAFGAPEPRLSHPNGIPGRPGGPGIGRPGRPPLINRPIPPQRPTIFA